MRKTTVHLFVLLCLWSCASLMAAERSFRFKPATVKPGQLLCHLSFDDYGNDGLNVLKVQGGRDAVVRVNPDKPVEGLGEVTCITDKSILAGLPEGDGAVEIPCRTHIALPIPSALSGNPGIPYTIAMWVKFKDFDHYNCILNMPADNRQDCMAFLERGASPKLSLKVRGSKTTGTGGGFVRGKWMQLVFQFFQTDTWVRLNGRLICTQSVPLVGSRADCSKAEGYFLLSADNSGEDASMYWADVKVYSGIVTPPAAPEQPVASSSAAKPPRRASTKDVPLPPLPSVVAAPKAPTVKPLVSDDFMNAATRKAAIAHVRESLRELVGPMSDEANAAFEKRWNAVADYPAPEILDWLKKASPVISEQVRLKAAVDAGTVACDDALREAAYAQTFGNAAAEREQMRAYAECLTAMKTAQARMNALQKQLDALGEMPDPDELKAADRRVAIKAEQTVKDIVGTSTEKDVSCTPEASSAEAGEYWVLTKTTRYDGKKAEDDVQVLEVTSRSADGANCGYPRNYSKAGMIGRDDFGNQKWEAELKFDSRQIEYRKSYTILCQKRKWTSGRVVVLSDLHEIDRYKELYLARWQVPKAVRYVPNVMWTIALTGGFKQEIEPKVSVHGKMPQFDVALTGSQGKEKGILMSDKTLKFTLPFNQKKVSRVEIFQLSFPAVPALESKRGGYCNVAFRYELKTLSAEEAAALAGPEVVAEPAVAVVAEQTAKTPEEKAEAIAFHRQNIAFIEGTISRLQKELAGEKDSSRRAALEWQIVCERSNIVYEQDRIRAEETGTFSASRTPFDEMCQIQQRENTLRQIQEAERLNRLYDLVDNLRSKQSLRERDATDKIVEQLLAEDPMNAAKWSQLANALWKKELGAREGAIAKADDAIARVDEQEGYFRLGCDSAMLLLGGAGAPRVLMLAYQMEKGYLDDGVVGAAKGAVCFYSDAIDIAWSAYDGYKTGGLEGVLKEGAMSYVMNKGMPYLMKKVNGWAAKKTATQTKAKVSADVKSYDLEVKRAKDEISEFVRAQNAFNQAKLEHMTDRQLTKIKSDLTVATARVNANPTAKACLKYDTAYKKVGEAFDGTLGKIHETIKTKFYADMKAKGFNDQEIMQFRNASSKGTVGMDADWGLKETPGMKITRNGKHVSLSEWQREATESWNRVYKKSTGFDAQKSWENVTTHAHAEAYRNMEILKYSKDANNMDEILSKLNASDAQQAFDVVRYKADMMLNDKDFPRLVYVREAVRGTAKDMKSKLLPALDVKIKALQKTQAELTRQGKALSKSDAHNLARLEAAKAHYEAVMKTFDDIGTAKMSPEDWDDAIRTVTGGRGISESINDMADLFKSLVL